MSWESRPLREQKMWLDTEKNVGLDSGQLSKDGKAGQDRIYGVLWRVCNLAGNSAGWRKLDFKPAAGNVPYSVLHVIQLNGDNLDRYTRNQLVKKGLFCETRKSGNTNIQSTSSSWILGLIRRWLTGCQDSHVACNDTAKEAWLPTRLIEINVNSDKGAASSVGNE
jgi:hypothetical protein